MSPPTVYTEDRVQRVIDGVSLEPVANPGESEDQICVWLPRSRSLCPADTYYACWLNLYAVRGG